MSSKSCVFSYISTSRILVLASAIAFVGCGGSDSKDPGYVKFYNSSKNAPEIILTLDEDLESDDDDDKDNFEVTFSGIEYTNALSNFEIDDDTYFYEMGYQDEDSADRDDLELVAEGQVVVEKEMIQLLVLMDDINSAKVSSASLK